MSDRNKAILIKGNAAIRDGNYEEFLSLCSEDTTWIFVGDTTLRGKEAVRKWMIRTYINPPTFNVTILIAEGDFVTATGDITIEDENGVAVDYSYCDIWRLRDEQLVELRAFVIKMEPTSHPSVIK